MKYKKNSGWRWHPGREMKNGLIFYSENGSGRRRNVRERWIFGRNYSLRNGISAIVSQKNQDRCRDYQNKISSGRWNGRKASLKNVWEKFHRILINGKMWISGESAGKVQRVLRCQTSLWLLTQDKLSFWWSIPDRRPADAFALIMFIAGDIKLITPHWNGAHLQILDKNIESEEGATRCLPTLVRQRTGGASRGIRKYMQRMLLAHALKEEKAEVTSKFVGYMNEHRNCKLLQDYFKNFEEVRFMACHESKAYNFDPEFRAFCVYGKTVSLLKRKTKES